MYDVAIIGAGVVGAMIARSLSAFNLKILILEKENDVSMGATKANSAIVHAGFDAESGSLKAKLNVLGSNMMEKVTKELGVKYVKNGSLVIGFNDDDKKMLGELLLRGEKNGVKQLRIIEKDELAKIEPNISENATCALWAPSGAIICPYELCIAAIGNAMDNGAELRLNFGVDKIEKKPEGFDIFSGEEKVCARFIVNAAGVHADSIAKMAGDSSFDIHPRKGEYILLDKECGKILSHTVFRTPTKMGKGILVSPTVDGNLLLGPTSVDISDKENKDTEQISFDKIIKEAKENVNGIELGKRITSFCGLRAVGSTGDFIINSPVKNFVNAAAIESPGLSSSPAIAEMVVSILKESGLKLERKDSYNPIRKPMHAFQSMTIDEKNEVIKKDKSYGKIVCRCEEITEGEILDAIRTNPGARDLDGIKRRTRAQMGRCQGGFCGPQIAEILAKELQADYGEITKSGKGSYINLARTKGE